MKIYYLDASVIVKYFHREPGTAWVQEIINLTANGKQRANLIYLSEISRVEVPAAFAILARTQQISIRLRDSLYDSFLQKVDSDFQSLPMGAATIHRAGELTQKHPLKAYDAIQLAVALNLNETLREQSVSSIFVSGDADLLRAAQAEGLITDNPFDHRSLDTNRVAVDPPDKQNLPKD